MCSTLKESSIENGMARLTSRALRMPMTRNMTISTSTRPVRMLFSRSATIFFDFLRLIHNFGNLGALGPAYSRFIYYLIDCVADFDNIFTGTLFHCDIHCIPAI